MEQTKQNQNQKILRELRGKCEECTSGTCRVLGYLGSEQSGQKEIWMDGMDKSEELKEMLGIRGRGTDTRIWMCT